MNIKEYIESGILQRYAFGTVNEAERLEVETNIQDYPELKAALEAIISALEEQHTQQEEQLSSAPESPAEANKRTKKARSRNLTSITALLLLGALALYFFNKGRQLERQTDEAELRIGNLIADRDLCNTDLRQLRIKLNLMRAPGNRPFVLEGSDIAVMVHYNQSSKKCYLDILKLPTLAEGKQFQLWAIVNGKPSDVGPLDLDLVADNFIEIDYQADASGFMLSEEPFGGSATPTQVVLKSTK